ncbi:MAG TPA: DUF72 domain-containing protein [Candidatus Tectomicrobia bacterium]|jgi:uncharacterized protein YecE (DUF72 family)
MPRRTHAQLDLFQSPAAAPQEQVVGAAAASPELVAVAQRLPQDIYPGTSSWAFPGWQGLVYDRIASESQLARHGLAAYAQHPLLRAVGLDRTYYAPLPAADFAAYAAVVPDAFRFLVKAHALCTHAYMTRRNRAAARPGERNALFLDAAYATEQVVGPCMEGLSHKAGPLVFQFPPQDVQAVGGPQGFAERLHAFLAALPRGPLYAVELRNTELLVPAYAAALADLGVCHCYNVHPRMPALHIQQCVASTAAPALVVRWMLHPRLGYDAATVRYQPFDRLIDADTSNRAAIARLCLEAVTRGCPAYVIANNKAEGSAPLTVFRLAECIVDPHLTPVRHGHATS